MSWTEAGQLLGNYYREESQGRAPVSLVLKDPQPACALTVRSPDAAG